jgi:hypothetical protein
VAGVATGRERWAAAVPLVLAAAVYTVTAAGRAVADADEGVYVHIPQQMLARGDWITPYVNGVRSLDKPPLLYWLIALSYTLFGQSEFAARIPSIAGVCGTVWLVQRIAGMLAGPRAGVAAGLAFAFSVGTFLFTLEVMHDILLVFFLTLAMSCFVVFERRGGARPWPVAGFFAAAAGAFLAKGLLGIVLPAGIVATYLVLSRRLPPVRLRWLFLGTLLFAALALPWHVAMEARNPGFLRVYFLEEQILRFFGRREPVDYESVPLPLFWALIPVWLFPWSVFLPGAVFLRRGGLRLLAGCWAGFPLAFFSVSSRLEHYAFPLLAPLAILAGAALTEQRGVGWELRFLKGLGAALAVAAVLLGVVWFTGYGLPAEGGGHPERTHSTDFSILTDFPAEVLRELLLPAIVVSAAMAACFLLARRRILAALTLAMVVFHGAAAYSIRVAEEIVSSKAFGQVLARDGRPGDTVIVFGDYETANSINFYAPLPLYVCEGAAPSLGPGLRYPDAPRLLLSREDLVRRWRSSERVWLIADGRQVEELDLDPAFPIAESAGRVLMSNRPVTATE